MPDPRLTDPNRILRQHLESLQAAGVQQWPRVARARDAGMSAAAEPPDAPPPGAEAPPPRVGWPPGSTSTVAPFHPPYAPLAQFARHGFLR